MRISFELAAGGKLNQRDNVKTEFTLTNVKRLPKTVLFRIIGKKGELILGKNQ